MKKPALPLILRIVSYVLVAALASAVTLCFFGDTQTSKLEELEELIQEKFIGEVDRTAIEDAAANAMIEALPDRWSYYISADEYQAYKENKNNSYFGIGISIQAREDETGFDIVQTEARGPAKEAGVLPGDILVEVGGQNAFELGSDGISDVILGEEGTTVTIVVLRDGQRLTFEVERRQIQRVVAEGQLLDGNIGLVKISNFNTNCFDETKAAVEQLLEQGAEALIFDVRYNPGGYKSELVKVLDYLLPEGPLFRSLSYTGEETVDISDENCLEIPMAVLVNGSSYSAAEFFAAALEEYDWAVVVGVPTCGKGYFQNTYQMTDGSAVALSVGKYFTPDGVCLADVGGLVPEVQVEVDEETAAKIYAGSLEPAEDPQIQAAVTALQEGK